MKRGNDSWIVSQIRQHLDALHSHVGLVYPLADIDRTLREAFANLASHGRLGLQGANVWAWLRREVRRIVAASGTPSDQHAAAVIFCLVDSEASLGCAVVPPVSQLLALLPTRQQELLRLITVESFSTSDLAYVLDVDYTSAHREVGEAESALRRLCAEWDSATADEAQQREEVDE